MAALLDKKQALNRNKTLVPDETGKKSFEFIRVTSVGISTGRFYVSVPTHLHNVADFVSRERQYTEEDGDPVRIRGIFYRDGMVEATTKNEAIDDWESLMVRCEQYLKTEHREKVILIRSEMSIHVQRSDGTYLNRHDISFAKVRPLIGVQYEILYKNGPDILDEDNRWQGKASDHVVIPYTEEREAFLQSIVDSLTKAALQVDQLTRILKEEPLQIDTIMKKGFLLEHKGSE